MIGIEGLGIYTPQNRKDLRDIEVANTLGISEEDIRRFTSKDYGFSLLPVEEKLSISEMAIEAVKDLNNCWHNHPIDLVIFIHAFPYPSHYWIELSKKLKGLLNQDFLWHTMSHLSCTTLIAALHTINRYLSNHQGDPMLSRVLLICVDKVEGNQHYVIPNSIMADGATACLIVNNQNPKIKLIDNLVLIDSRTYLGVQSSKAALNWFDLTISSFIRKSIEKILTENDLEIDDIKFFAVSNINKKLWSYVARSINVSQEKFITNISINGHSYNSDPLVNLASVYNLTLPGDKVLLISVGLGGAVGCSLVEI